MRILISGSRDWTDHNVVRQVISEVFTRTHGSKLYVRHGAARGLDTIGKMFVLEMKHAGWAIDQEPFPAWWQHPNCDHEQGFRRDGGWYCKAAGPLRNQRMLDAPGDIDEAHFFPLPESRGTWDMWDRAVAAGIPCFNHGVERESK